MPVTDLVQPNPSSMRFRMRWLAVWPGCLVVRLSMAEWRLVFSVDVGRHFHRAKRGHKVGSIKVLGGCQGDRMRRFGALLDHLKGRQAFGVARVRRAST